METVPKLTVAAEEAIIHRMMSSAPDDVLQARPPVVSRQVFGISLREIGCEPVAFTECPTGALPNEPVYNSVATIHNRLRDVTSEAKRLAEDRLLSTEGRAAKLMGAWEPVRGALNQLEGVLTAEASQIEDVEKEVFKVPALEPTNVVEALCDVERRRWFNELDSDARLKFAREMYEGRHEDIIAALVRSPIPGLARDFANAAWRASVERKHPQRVQGLAKRRDRLEWARAAMRGAANAMSEWHSKNRPQARAA